MRWRYFIIVLMLGIYTPSAQAQELNGGDTIPYGGYLQYQHMMSGKYEPQYLYLWCHIPANHLGVITLVRLRGNSDQDPYIVERIKAKDEWSAEVSGILAKNTNSDTLPNVAIVDPSSNPMKHLIYLHAADTNPGEYRVYCHSVDIAEELVTSGIQAFFMTMLQGQLGKGDVSDWSQRALSTGLSLAQRDNVLAVGIDAIINELAIELTQEFPDNPGLVNFGTAFVGNIFQDIYKFSFREML